MLRNVFTKTLRDQFRGLVGWSAGLAATVVFVLALWPTVRDMPGLDEMLANYPEAFLELFDVQTMGTPAGYLNAELLSIMAPLLFIVFGVARGARLLAGEEEQGTLDMLLSVPQPRSRILLEKAAALLVCLGVLGVVMFATLAAGSLVLDMGLGAGGLAAASASMVLLGAEFGLLAFAVAATTGRRGTAVAVAGGAGVVAYLVYAFAGLVEELEPWGALSPFQHAVGYDTLTDGLDVGYALAMAAVAAIALAASLPLFARRDIAV